MCIILTAYLCGCMYAHEQMLVQLQKNPKTKKTTAIKTHFSVYITGNHDVTVWVNNVTHLCWMIPLKHHHRNLERDILLCLLHMKQNQMNFLLIPLLWNSSLYSKTSGPKSPLCAFEDKFFIAPCFRTLGCSKPQGGDTCRHVHLFWHLSVRHKMLRCIRRVPCHQPLMLYSRTDFPCRPAPPIIQDIFSSPVSCQDRLCVKHLRHGPRVTHVSR